MSEKVNTPELRDRRAQLMVRFLNSARQIEVFKGKRIEEIFNNEKEKRKLINEIKPENFLELINGINGILRAKERKDWKIDGDEVYLEGWIESAIPPRFGDKKELLMETLEGLKLMNNEGRDLDDMAILLSSSINEIHPYSDANGRTSRLVYSLLTKGFNEESKKVILEILGEYGRDKVDISPGLIKAEIDELIIKESGIKNAEVNTYGVSGWFFHPPRRNLQFSKNVTDERKREFIDLIGKDDYMNILVALFKFIIEKPHAEKYIKEFPERKIVVLENLCPDLVDDDVEQIVATYWSLKKRHAEILIDLIVNPEKEEYQLEINGGKISLLQYFKEEIIEQNQRNQDDYNSFPSPAN